MGIPILASREIGSSKRIPVPRKINESLSHNSPDGRRSAFWHVQKGRELALLSNKPLTDHPDFNFLGQSEYLGERKENGDLDIRPIKRVSLFANSDFENDTYSFFMLHEDWLEESPCGAYILTTSDLTRRLPILRRMKEFHSSLFDNNSTIDTKRPQENGMGYSPQQQAILNMFERTGITEIEKLVNQIFTNGRIETELELPAPTQ